MKIYIEYIQNRVPFDIIDEYVVIFNQSKASSDLDGWQLIYEKITESGETEVFRHNFERLKGGGSFEPGERICLISGKGKDKFKRKSDERTFPCPHWDIYTKHPLHVLSHGKVKVTLIDGSGIVLDSKISEMKPSQSKFETPSMFIGHGGNKQWVELKSHLQDKHNFRVTAYEIGARAGLSVKEILEKMLRESSFALLVMTGEDVDSKGLVHPRENVIHELGLFQGKLGFNKAIMLLEDNVQEFSNMKGISQIRFQEDNIQQIFGDILATIKREQKN